jgi:hypothetical protein
MRTTSSQAMATTTGPKIFSRARRKLLSPPENSMGTWKYPSASGPLLGGNPPSSTRRVASPSSRYSLSYGAERGLVDHRADVAGLVQRVPDLHRTQPVAQPGEHLVVHVAVQVQPGVGGAALALPADP